MANNINNPPLVVHIIYRLDVGGLENGLVNLINHMPPEKYRHVIICLTNYTDFRERIKQPDVEVYALDKKEGKDIRIYLKLWRLLLKIKPDIVHTRNMGTIDCIVVAMLAGVKHRVHSEHGREGQDSNGRYKKYNTMRRLVAPLLTAYIALSKDLSDWLANTVGIASNKLVQIYNGVDAGKFKPHREIEISQIKHWRSTNNTLVIGTVGRMAEIKDQITLAHAFVETSVRLHENNTKVFVVMIGDGVLKPKIMKIFQDAKLASRVWLPGDRNDIAEVLNSLDVFVLPSRNEGISNTILEAMSCALPIIATRVGGNPELVRNNSNGFLVSPENPSEMADAIEKYVHDRELIVLHGKHSRQQIEKLFSMESMVNAYMTVYDAALMSTAKQTE